MIRYTIKCDQDHTFDSWFHSAEGYEKLKSNGLVTCAICGSSKVDKAIMAPRVRPSRNAASSEFSQAADEDNIPESDTAGNHTGPLSQAASPAEQALSELRNKIEANSENVGDDFAKEARAIHAGEAPERAIIGQARPDEAKALIDDGIPVAPLPWQDRKTN